MPEIAPPPLGLVGPVDVPPEPPAALLPKPVFDGAPGLGVVTPVLGACWLRITPAFPDGALVPVAC
jgi:hypothetical protein